MTHPPSSLSRVSTYLLSSLSSRQVDTLKNPLKYISEAPLMTGDALELRGMIFRVVLAGHYNNMRWNLTGCYWHEGLQQWYSDNVEPLPNQSLFAKLFEEFWNDCHYSHQIHPTLQDC